MYICVHAAGTEGSEKSGKRGTWKQNGMWEEQYDQRVNFHERKIRQERKAQGESE